MWKNTKDTGVGVYVYVWVCTYVCAHLCCYGSVIQSRYPHYLVARHATPSSENVLGKEGSETRERGRE